MTGNQFRKALHSGKSVYGTLITSSSPRMFDTVIRLRPDFVFLCTEHIFYNPDSLGWMCRAYRAAGINPVVRIASPDPYLAAQALDAGAGTILVPYAEDLERVAELVGAVKYRPLKGRRLKNILLGREKPDQRLAEYLRDYNSDSSLLLNIESPEGVRNMNDFFSLSTPDGPGIDGIVIGPHDLSVSHDMPEQYGSSEFIELSCDIIRKARKAGVAAGGHTGSRQSLQLQLEWAMAGANIIIHSSDIFLFADRYNEEMNQIRSVKGDDISEDNSGTSV